MWIATDDPVHGHQAGRFFHGYYRHYCYLPSGDYDARTLYEDLYCARGDMENRIKEQQLALFVDRTSTHELHANQLRLYFSSFACVLMQIRGALRLELGKTTQKGQKMGGRLA